MKEKKSPKLVVLVIIGLILIILLGVQVYASVKGYGNVFFLIRDLTTTKDASGVDDILINDEEKIDEEKNDNQKETELSDKEIKESINNYLELVGRKEGGPSSLFDLFGYDQDDYMLEEPKIIYAEDGYNQYVQTKIRYEEFKREILNYITEKLYEDEYDYYYLDEEGYVYYMSVGATGGKYELVDVVNITDNEYEVKYDSINPDNSKDRYIIDLVIKEVDGKCVIDSHSEVKLDTKKLSKEELVGAYTAISAKNSKKKDVDIDDLIGMHAVNLLFYEGGKAYLDTKTQMDEDGISQPMEATYEVENNKIILKFKDSTVEELKYNNDLIEYKYEQYTLYFERNDEFIFEGDNYADEVVKDEVKALFLDKIKKDDENNTDKLIDYRIDEVELLSEESIKEICDMDSSYKTSDTYAYITYSVKPEDIETSSWYAGSGSVSGEWIVNKVSCVCIRDGKIIVAASNW